MMNLATGTPDNFESATAIMESGSSTDEKVTLATESDKPSTTIDKSEPEYLTGVKLMLVLASATLATFLVLLDMVILATAVPRITSQFHSLPDVGWYGSAYQLASASFQPLAGKLYTHLSSKWVYITFFAIFELGSLVCALAINSRMLIVGRAVAGLGASGMMNGALTIVSACAPTQQQPMLLGVLLATSQIGIAIGPTVGGAFTEFVSWRWCFWINLPAGALVAIVLLWIHIPDQIIKEKLPLFEMLETLDLIGFALFLPAAIMFFLALEYGGTQLSWNSPTVIGLFVGAGLTLIIFLVWEQRRGEKAMLPFQMMSKRIVWSSCLMRLFYMGDIIVVSYYLPIYFQTVKGVSPVKSGYYTLPVILIQMILAVVSSGAITKFGYYLPWIIASGVVMAIGDGLYSLLGPSTPTATWIGYELVSGIGNGLGSTIPMIAIQSTLPKSDQSIAMALLILFQNFGGSFFLTFAETIFSNSLSSLLSKFVPGVDANTIIAAGATGWRDILSNEQVEGVIKAYTESIDRVFYLAIGTSVGALIFASRMGWVDIRTKKDVEPNA